jgi:hypothetical protein
MRDPAPAVARDPHPAVVNAAVQLATAPMLLHEGVEGGEDLPPKNWTLSWL